MRKDNEAATSIIGFIIAIFVFSAVFATAIEFTIQRGGKHPEARRADLNVVAAKLGEGLLNTPGHNWYSANACTNGVLDLNDITPDAVDRFGIGIERCGISSNDPQSLNNLSFEKIENIYRAGDAADAANGFADYEEALASLQLDERGYDFHVRGWPLRPDIQEVLRSGGKKDNNLKVLYIGNYTRPQGGQDPNLLVQHTKGIMDQGDTAKLWVNVTNNGTLPTEFTVKFTVKTKHDIVVEMHTPMLLPTNSFNVTFLVNKTKDWEWKHVGQKEFDYLIRDPSHTVGEGTVSFGAIDMASPPTNRKILMVEMSQLVWVRSGPSVTVTIGYDALNGKGQSNVAYTDWWLQLRYDSNETIIKEWAPGDLSNNGGTVSYALANLDIYKAVLKGGANWIANEDYFEVVAAQPSDFIPLDGLDPWEPGPSVKPEANFIDAVIEKFDLGVFDVAYTHPDMPWAPGGDVYPDDNNVLADELPILLRETPNSRIGTTDNYSLVIVGSGVDHETMTSGNIKWPIEDFVHAGGTLLVFGSQDQAVQWMQPLFGVAIDGGGGGINTPDASHPILTTPNKLDYAAFDDHDIDWSFTQDTDAEHFTHVVLSGDGDDIVAVSDPGEFQKGRIVLTSWQPFDLVPSQADHCTIGAYDQYCQPLQMIQNFLTIGYRELYIDYGPRVPSNAETGSSSRIATVWHPHLQTKVDMQVLTYVFR